MGKDLQCLEGCQTKGERNQLIERAHTFEDSPDIIALLGVRGIDRPFLGSFCELFIADRSSRMILHSIKRGSYKGMTGK